MAARLWKLCSKHFSVSQRILKTCEKRTLLSDAYGCNEVWQDRLSSPLMSQVVPDDFCLKLHEKFEAESRVNAVDIDILVNRLSEVTVVELDFVEEMLYRFRHTQDALHVLDSTHSAIVREYLKMNQASRLLPLIGDKIGYGLFPDAYSANLLLDHFIEARDFAAASKVACDLMLQDMLDLRSSNLLCLYASYMQAKHLLTSEGAVEEQETASEEDEEVQFIPVKYVTEPWYDDHFHITCEKWLLGKTLAMAAKQHDSLLGTNLQLIGWGLYNKFDKGLEVLRSLKDSQTVADEALRFFKQSLEEADAKTEDIVREHGMQTLDDERLNARISEEQKANFLTEFEVVYQNLSKSQKISSEDLESTLTNFVQSQLPGSEAEDMQAQKELFKEWDRKRQEELTKQIKKYLIYEKRKVIEQRLLEIQEKEELLNYFDRQDEIEVAQLKAPPVVEEVVDEDEDIELEDKKVKQKRR